MSILRIIGILCGLVSLGASFYRLRSHAEKRTDVWLLIVFGLTLVIVSLFPNLVNFPAELLLLRGHEKGRVITLLLISNAFLWFFYLYERNKAEQRYFQFDGLVRGLTVREFIRDHIHDIVSGSIVILMPAYNEADNLVVILPRIPQKINSIPVNILLIDDGSSDDTHNIAKKSGALVATHPTNMGGGAALRTGYDIIRKLDPVVIITMDADGQHSPEEIGTLVEPILQDKADFVIGSRVLGSSADYSRIRSCGVHVFSKLINIIVGTTITDCSSGFRAFNRAVLENCLLIQEQYHTAELIIEASKRGFRIRESPVNISCRLSGKSKKGKNLKYALYFLRTIIKSWLR